MLSRNPTILIVDDDKDIVHLMQSILEDDGYDVTAAMSGEEAVELIEKGQFDVILTDLMMGSIGGIDVLRRAKEADPLVKVIVMTGKANISLAIEAIRFGIDDFLEKTTDIAEVLMRIRNAFERGQMEKKISLYERYLAICSVCRDIRDDTGVNPGEGEWKRLEQYMEERANIEITHGLCPTCFERSIQPTLSG